jgi:hypothetical protein
MPDPPRLISDVVVALAAIKPAGAEAAFLESCVPIRTDTDRCVRASQPIPCLRGQRDGRGRRSFLRDNPRLRLREVSKARQVIKIVVSSHGTPPSLPALDCQDRGLCRNWRATSTTLWGGLWPTRAGGVSARRARATLTFDYFLFRIARNPRRDLIFAAGVMVL